MLATDKNAYGVGHMDLQAALMYFAAGNQDAAVLSDLTTDFDTWRNTMVTRSQSTVWQTTLLDEDYYWGSNFPALATPLAFAVGSHFLGDDLGAAADLARDAMNYVLGVNPLQFSYVSGYGENSLQRPFSMIYNFDMKEGVPPGIMVGGANAYNNSFLYSKFAAKSYQDNAAAWSTNEHTIYWNAALVFNAALVASATESGMPTAAYTPSATQLAVAFDGSASFDSDGTIVSYAWDFGDGNSATGATANHTYAAAGSYVVVLTVTDNDNNSDSTSQTVTVDDGSQPTPTPTNTPAPTATPTNTPTATPTAVNPTNTPTPTNTPLPTNTPTATPTAVGPTNTPTPTSTPTNTPTPTATPSGGGTAFLETFDGNPSAPLAFDDANWDVGVHTHNYTSPYSVTADFGSDCAALPATHIVSSVDDAAFICDGRLVTALQADSNGQITFVPNQIVDFSQNEVSITFDVSTDRAVGKDWFELWVMPWDENLALAAEDWNAPQGLPSDGIHIRLNDYENKFVGQTINNEAVTPLNGSYNWQPYDCSWSEDTCIDVMADKLTTFELKIKPATTAGEYEISFGMVADGDSSKNNPLQTVWYFNDTDVVLDWTQAIVQFGHHAKDSSDANSWQWDNISISEATEFDIIKGDLRSIDAISDTVTFDSAAPSGTDTWVRFNAGGNSMSLTAKDAAGNVLVTKTITPQVESADRDEYVHSYFVSVPVGTKQVQLTGSNWSYGSKAWYAKDLTLWVAPTANGASIFSQPLAHNSPANQQPNKPVVQLASGDTNQLTSQQTNRPTTAKLRQQSSSTGYIERLNYGMGGMGIALRVTDTISVTNSGLYYIHSDHLGSLSLMTDVNGDVVADSIVRHLPFGGYRGGDPSDELRNLTDAGYTGHAANDPLRLIYMGARFYSGDLRRFVSADTIIPSLSNSQSYNRFSYVMNSPLSFNDPTGHSPNPCPQNLSECDFEFPEIELPDELDPISGRHEYSEDDLKLIALLVYVENHNGNAPHEVDELLTWILLNRSDGGDVFATLDSTNRGDCPPGVSSCGAWFNIIGHFILGEGTFTDDELGQAYAKASPSERKAAALNAFDWYMAGNSKTVDKKVFSKVMRNVKSTYGKYLSGKADPTSGSTFWSHRRKPLVSDDANLTKTRKILATNFANYAAQHPGFVGGVTEPYFIGNDGEEDQFRIFVWGNDATCVPWSSCGME